MHEDNVEGYATVTAAANGRIAAGEADAPFLEFPVAASELRNKLVMNAPEQVDGWVTVSDTPGLGIDLDSDVLRQYHLP